MAQILIRNLDAECVERLERRAAENGRSLEAEAKLILEDAARLDMATARYLAGRVRSRLCRRTSVDSVEVLRELRDA